MNRTRTAIALLALTGCGSSLVCPAGFTLLNGACVADDAGLLDAGTPDAARVDTGLRDAGPRSVSLRVSPSAFALHPGETRAIDITAESVGLASRYTIEVANLGFDVTAAPISVDPGGPRTVRLMFTANATATPAHIEAIVASGGIASGLSTPVALQIEIVGAPGREAIPAPSVVWTSPSPTESQHDVQSVQADQGGLWAVITYITISGHPATYAYDNRLWRIDQTGMLVGEFDVFPTALELGLPPAFDHRGGGTLVGARSGGGLYLLGTNNDGVSLTAVWLATIDDTGHRIAVQLVAGPAASPGCRGFAVAGDVVVSCANAAAHRYDPDLTMRLTFGVSGSVLISGYPVGLQGDGLFVQSTSGYARYQTSGRGDLDPSFAGDGFLNLSDPVAGRAVASTSGLVFAPGAFFVSGDSRVSAAAPLDYIVWHVAEEGTVDSSFGAGGVIRFPRPPTYAASPVQAFSDGSVLLSGYDMLPSGSSAAWIERRSSSGALDTAFGTAGGRVENNGAGHIAADEPSGRLYVVDEGGNVTVHVYWL